MAAKAEKAYYQFNRGINTEGSLIAFPEGFSADEENYDLKVDGSRRRRRGLSLETGGLTLTTSVASGWAYRSHKWENVDGNPSLNFKIIQIGGTLHIYEDSGSILSTGRRASTINLTSMKVADATTTDVATSYVDVSYGRGHAFVVGKYIKPFYIEYEEDGNILTVVDLQIMERDFEGIEDGVAMNAFPTTLSATHSYNLRNRGWPDSFISAFFTSQAKYPSKAMIAYLGLKRTLTAADNYDLDGIRTFSPDKLVAELFQDASAPQGHFLRDPFRPVDVPATSIGDPITISNVVIPSLSAGTHTFTITTSSNHGFAIGERVNISGHAATVYAFTPVYGEINMWFSLDGSHNIVSVPSANSFTIEKTIGSEYDSVGADISLLSPVTNGSVFETAEGSSLTSPWRPTCTSFYAGRVWYAGTPFKSLATRIFFTQIIESAAQYGKCYQVADPTDERISDIVPSDGGVVVIPEVGTIVKLLPYGSFLLIFATNGVWQLSGGNSGVFSATSYSIRKITENGCISGPSVVLANGIPYYCGTSDIHRLVEDPNSGLLVSQNITESNIHTLYTDILEKSTIQGEYDEVSHRIVWLYKSSSTTPTRVYDKALLLHTILGAFTKYSFPYVEGGYVVGVSSLRDSTLVGRKLKFLTVTGASTQFTIAECNASNFSDFNIQEPSAFIISGPETLGDASKHRYAPYVWVFSKKTETGYVVDEPVGESSTKLQGRWDWADLSSSGKWSPVQEVYRHLRMYVPTSSSDTYDDGVPLIITRNRMRGKGRTLQLKFSAGTGKDSWIAGWHVKHDIHTEN